MVVAASPVSTKRTPAAIRAANFKRCHGTLEFGLAPDGSHLRIATRKNHRSVDLLLLVSLVGENIHETVGGQAVGRMTLTPKLRQVLGLVNVPDQCERCQGRGRIFNEDEHGSACTCPACHGSGRAAELEDKT